MQNAQLIEYLAAAISRESSEIKTLAKAAMNADPLTLAGLAVEVSRLRARLSKMRQSLERAVALSD